MLNMSLEKQIQQKLSAAGKILLVAHRKPDGDTLGATGALFLHLKKIGKTVNLFCVDAAPANLNYLPGVNDYFHDKQKLNLNDYDVIVALDCGELKQTGIEDILSQRSSTNFFINIDHHFTNDNYGDLNLVNPTASSTSEIVYDYFKMLKIEISKDMTDSLLTGILTDTTYFSNGGTTIESVKAASDLLSKGAGIKQITAQIVRNKNIATLKLWGKVFSRLMYDKERQIATAVVTQEDFQESGATPEAIEGISNFLTNLEDARLIMVLMQIEDNIIKISLRTTRDDVNVAALAKQFGGGGHKKAAGCTVAGRLIMEEKGWKII
jgi:bifunctional oligoribonuclease and PAP phosphatase NrnA